MTGQKVGQIWPREKSLHIHGIQPSASSKYSATFLKELSKKQRGKENEERACSLFHGEIMTMHEYYANVPTFSGIYIADHEKM
jgi:hypothetical protein